MTPLRIEWKLAGRLALPCHQPGRLAFFPRTGYANNDNMHRVDVRLVDHGIQQQISSITMSMKTIRPKLALILFGMILGALCYRSVNSLVIDRAPDVTQHPTSGTGPVKWENDAVVALTNILPSAPGKATIIDGSAFSGGTYQPHTRDAGARIRVVAYASSAEPNEAVIAIFLAGGKSPLALASKPTVDNRREKIELSLDIPRAAGQLDLEFRVGPGQPGTIVFNGPNNAPERAVTLVTVTE